MKLPNLKMTINKRKAYSGEVVIEFRSDDKDLHEYRVTDGMEMMDGVRIPSVSEIKRIINKPELEDWKLREAVKVIKEHWQPDYTYDEDTIYKIIKDAETAHKDISDNGKTVGSFVHDWIEAFLAGENPDPPKEEQRKRSVDAFLEWIHKEQVDITFSEMLVYSREHKYAGTLDGEGTVNGKAAIVDFKTSNRIYDMDYRLQTAAYQLAREEEIGYPYIDERWIVRIDKRDGTLETKVYTRDEYEDDRKDVLSAIHLYYRNKELK